MDKSKLLLSKISGEIFVVVERKKIQNVHLKVYRDLTVKLSVPENVSDAWTQEFLLKRKDWIEKQLFKFKQAQGENNLILLKNGCSIQMLGKEYRIFFKVGKKDIVIDENKITMFTKDVKNERSVTQYFEKWWHDQSKKTYSELIDHFYKVVFRKYHVVKPTIQIRRMRTMWGNCNQQKGVVTLNKYLFKASLSSIEYVIMHEMTHLIYPNHDANFYNFLTVHMPNWQERKKNLDLDVVQGI